MKKLIFLLTIPLIAGSSLLIAHATNTNNTFKFWTPRDTVMFSARFARGRETDGTIITATDYMNTADAFGANALVWHYPQIGSVFSDEVINLAKARNYRNVQCALPPHTRIPAHACKDQQGNAIVHHAGSTIYYPDTQNPGFRNEVSNFLRQAEDAGCTSYQQDDAYFMVTRRPLGCYASTPESTVKGYVRNYYDWLFSQIRAEHGTDVPVTFNKKFHPTDERQNPLNELSHYFNSAMAEVEPEQNFPGALYDAIVLVNNHQENLTTVTTLVDESVLYNRRHIATVYALASHPIAPYDVYLEPGRRAFGNPANYRPYYDLVRQNPQLFSGHGVYDAYIDHYKNKNGVIQHNGKLTGVSNRHNVMAVLTGSPTSRVLHVVNWQVNRNENYFTYWIDKSMVPYTPRTAVVRRPGLPDYTTSVIDNGDNRWKVTVSSVDIWAVAELRP